MHERTNIHLGRSVRSSLEAVVANRNSPQKHVWRTKIVLLTANGRGKAKTVIWRWQERFRDEGAAGLWRDKTRRSRIPHRFRDYICVALAGRVYGDRMDFPGAIAKLHDRRRIGTAADRRSSVALAAIPIGRAPAGPWRKKRKLKWDQLCCLNF